MIANHHAPRLSDLDMAMVESVPQGGNWKDIPTSIPSRRLEQIRESYARGEGSRSTYYGRLRPDRPSYTINTYFTRPGNGCHIHPQQDRVLSFREAARLQSFPDAFVFDGPQGAVARQIGNAVPPLLGCALGSANAPARFIDVFCGAGGLALGLTWAGWTSIGAVDLDRHAVATYRRNLGDAHVADLSDPSVRASLVAAARESRASDPEAPIWIVGGPPCQGFSTAGNQRSDGDPRNALVWDYLDLVAAVRPDGFIFENVTGLLSMSGGETFRRLERALGATGADVSARVLDASRYGVPQRRRRVVLAGTFGSTTWSWPNELTRSTVDEEGELPLAPTVTEALRDLPPLDPGQDGATMPYRPGGIGQYARLMRGLSSPAEYVDSLAVDSRRRLVNA